MALSAVANPLHLAVAEGTPAGSRVGYGTFMRVLSQTGSCERTSVGSAAREEREGSEAHRILPRRERDPIA